MHEDKKIPKLQITISNKIQIQKYKALAWDLVVIILEFIYNLKIGI
jgi:hypothetical protein